MSARGVPTRMKKYYYSNIRRLGGGAIPKESLGEVQKIALYRNVRKKV
jgi:hypothetical protein